MGLELEALRQHVAQAARAAVDVVEAVADAAMKVVMVPGGDMGGLVSIRGPRDHDVRHRAVVGVAVGLLVSASSLHVVNLIRVVNVESGSWHKDGVGVTIGMVVVDVNVPAASCRVSGLVARPLVPSFARKQSSQITCNL